MKHFIPTINHWFVCHAPAVLKDVKVKEILVKGKK
jgi:hypothetical protein